MKAHLNLEQFFSHWLRFVIKTRVIALLLLGLVDVIVYARLVVISGINIIIILSAPPILIGAKVVVIGTSLAELTMDLAAVQRGQIHLAIRDIIGSNLTNRPLILGFLLLLPPSRLT